MENQSKLKIRPFYRFVPSDRQLLYYFLLKKVYNKPLPPNNDVIHQDIYGCSPWELEGIEDILNGKKKVLYFLTRRKRKGNKGTKVDRKAGCGTWKDRGQSKGISFKGVKGKKNQFVFQDNSKNPMLTLGSGNWIMDEITIQREEVKFEDFSICKMRIKCQKKNRIELLKKMKGKLPQDIEEEKAATDAHDSVEEIAKPCIPQKDDGAGTSTSSWPVIPTPNVEYGYDTFLELDGHLNYFIDNGGYGYARELEMPSPTWPYNPCSDEVHRSEIDENPHFHQADNATTEEYGRKMEMPPQTWPYNPCSDEGSPHFH